MIRAEFPISPCSGWLHLLNRPLFRLNTVEAGVEAEAVMVAVEPVVVEPAAEAPAAEAPAGAERVGVGRAVAVKPAAVALPVVEPLVAGPEQGE
jgi:hypothetical protein